MEFWMNLVLSDWMYLWLAVIVITAVIEIITVGLTSIWISGGALAALIVCLLGGHPGLQIAVFFVVTFILLYFTRPWAKKYLDEELRILESTGKADAMAVLKHSQPSSARH